MPLGGVIFIVIFIALFGAFLLWVATKTGGKPIYHPIKYEPYECGIPALDKKDTKVSVKYYLTAILFILFDIEIIFMYPWSVSFREFIAAGNGGLVFFAMVEFIAIFVFGLFWLVKARALEWD
ncbi:NADH-quinone oxidoreductase subunit A [Bdellovibrio reynosensis]|uniref:NADH-quinone oxidoreductase subunit n=1 Tax=Bdellovibrio reynosensis TaxID=2835041 RepID=A0ABY4C674_9BACT|nr:NADH-quinone oxidoreductase subunit A [Bdellovibrio reynosensis]UOF00425.1 NADH-quinone oxidoreductase subunit A [Bdellovibrio reynosensis]